MTSDFLSDVELYYTTPDLLKNDLIIIQGEEVHHITRVMRHKSGDDIYVTDGIGSIYLAAIMDFSRDQLTAEVKSISKYDNRLSNLTFCLPRLKNPDRFEFALEKCVELGITSFIGYQAENSVSKGGKIERWQKIVLSAMKQCLRSYLPVVLWKNSLNEILKIQGNKIFLDQNSEKGISEISFNREENYLIIFGPEGGYSNGEKSLLIDLAHYHLTNNRLRSETAIITTAAIITSKI